MNIKLLNNKIRFIYVLPFLFHFGLKASNSAIFTTQALPTNPTVPSSINLRTTGFKCNVFGNGRVQGEFEIENKSNSYRQEFSLKMDFYSKSDRKGYLCSYSIPTENLVENGIDSFEYDFYIPAQQAKKMKSFNIIINSKQYTYPPPSNQSLLDWISGCTIL